MSVEFFLTSLVVVLIPGTGVIYTLAIGLGLGARASVWAAFGCTLGILPHIIASVAGLAALLHTSAVAFQIVRILGVAYLAYMAWNILQESGPLNVTETRTPSSPRKLVADGVLLNLLNPKLSLFFLAFLPQFVAADAVHPTIEMLGLAAIFMAMTLVVFVGYGTAASAVRTRIVSRPSVMAWLRRSFAGAFALLGLRLLTSEN